MFNMTLLVNTFFLQELLEQRDLDNRDLTSLLAERDLHLESTTEAQQVTAAQLQNSTSAQQVRALSSDPVCPSDALNLGMQPCCDFSV